MADISKITLPDGSSYDIKDTVARASSSNLFVVKYGVTTWSQVEDALGTDKVIIATLNDDVYSFAGLDEDDTFWFTHITFQYQAGYLSLSSNDTWTIGAHAYSDTMTSWYGTSATAASTAAKTVTATNLSTGYSLRKGNIISVKFTYANTANAPTLNIASTGAKAIWYKGTVTSSSNKFTWRAGDIVTFVYNGSIYEAISVNTLALNDITFVEYGVSTEAEVYAAQGNGKLVIAFDRNNTKRCAPLVYYSPASKYVFSFVDQDGSVELWQLSDNGTNTWSVSTGSYYVPKTRTVNGKALSSNVTLATSDITNDSGYITASDDITGTSANVTGTVGVIHGGTGKTTWTANYAVITGSSATGAFQQRAITNNTATSTAITASTNLVTMNTLRYAINRTTSVAAADTNYTTYMARGESLVTTDTTPTNNGEIAWVYG